MKRFVRQLTPVLSLMVFGAAAVASAGMNYEYANCVKNADGSGYCNGNMFGFRNHVNPSYAQFEEREHHRQGLQGRVRAYGRDLHHAILLHAERGGGGLVEQGHVARRLLLHRLELRRDVLPPVPPERLHVRQVLRCAYRRDRGHVEGEGWSAGAEEELSGVVTVVASASHSLAVLSDGTVWAWGDNPYGQLGDGTTNKRLVPVQVQGLSGVRAVAAGQYHSLAVRSDGTVWAWGDNFYGQLGDGTTSKRLVPAQVQGLIGVGAVAAGPSSYYTFFALRACAPRC